MKPELIETMLQSVKDRITTIEDAYKEQIRNLLQELKLIKFENKRLKLKIKALEDEK